MPRVRSSRAATADLGHRAWPLARRLSARGRLRRPRRTCRRLGRCSRRPRSAWLAYEHARPGRRRRARAAEQGPLARVRRPGAPGTRSTERRHRSSDIHSKRSAAPILASRTLTKGWLHEAGHASEGLALRGQGCSATPSRLYALLGTLAIDMEPGTPAARSLRLAL